MDSKKLLSKLTINEKIDMTSGHNMWSFMGNNRLGIKPIVVSDGPHGLRAYKTFVSESESLNDENLERTTLFPNARAMASTWNQELIYEVGKTIGKECNMFNVDVLLAPGINLKRSPLGGRNFEYYSEDPFLTSRIASSFVSGVQSEGVGACVKHFALNEQETQRRFVNSIADDRTLFEYYLEPFEYVIKNAKPYTIMSSYNRVNGDYASESKTLLIDILRSKWNYEGAVISDWGAVQNKVKSLKNGMNIEMPGPSEFNKEVIKALEGGQLSEEDIDNSLLPLFNLKTLIDENTNKGQKTNLQNNHLTARRVASEAIVLLKNNGVLPLEKKTKIAVIGKFATNPRINGGGSAKVLPYIKETPLEELSKVFSVDFAEGYNGESTDQELLEQVNTVVSSNETVIFFTGTTAKSEVESEDRKDILMPLEHIKVFKEIVKHNKKVIVVLNNGSALDLSEINEDSDAIIEAWFLGGANGFALTQIISGEINPSGKLSETFPICIENTPHYGLFPSKSDNVLYDGDIVHNGYRYYDTHKIPVRYPFGHGLSYTTFEYSNLSFNKEVLEEDEGLTVKLDVKNIGNKDGYEIIQLYIRDVESYYPQPFKKLKAFTKVFIKKGQKVNVELSLTKRDFSIYAVDLKDFVVEEGEFEILVGKSSQDICLRGAVFHKGYISLRNAISLEQPFYNFKNIKPISSKWFEEVYHELAWYEAEEPYIRILNRYRKSNNLTDDEFAKVIKMIEEE